MDKKTRKAQIDNDGDGFSRTIDIDQTIERMVNYWETYNSQHGYKDYSTETVIEDMLYSVGIALSEEYRFAQGFMKFKDDLMKYLDK